jgi:hypothetical protein
MTPRLALLAPLALAAAACPAKEDVRIDGVLLVQADGTDPAPDGPTIAVDDKTISAAIENPPIPAGAKLVRLAIARKVPWNQVRALAKKVESAGARPVFLVGRSYHLQSLRLEDAWPGGPALQVFAYIDGKVCVQPPGAIEAKCVQSSTKDYIERAYLRELVREQVRAFDVHQVELELPSTLPWADVVRSIDGSRTCCSDTKILVRLKPAPPS